MFIVAERKLQERNDDVDGCGKENVGVEGKGIV